MCGHDDGFGCSSPFHEASCAAVAVQDRSDEDREAAVLARQLIAGPQIGDHTDQYGDPFTISAAVERNASQVLNGGTDVRRPVSQWPALLTVLQAVS